MALGFAADISERPFDLEIQPSRKMPPPISDASLPSTVVRLLQETEIPRRYSIREHPMAHRLQPDLQAMPRLDLNEDYAPLTTSRRVIPRLDLDEDYIPSEPRSPTCRERIHLALGIPETTKPVRNPDLFQTIVKHTTPISSRLSDDSLVYASVYVTFPAYCPARVSKIQMAKNCARRIKTCLTTAGGKFLTGLQSVGEFYAQSEQKWENEYQPLESVPSDHPSVWEAVDAADRVAYAEQAQRTQKLSQKSWGKTLQSYWKPEPANRSSGHSISSHPPSVEQANAIPNVLRKRNNQRPKCLKSSHQPANTLQGRQMIEPCEPFEHGRQSRARARPRRRQQAFSPPKGRSYPLERQPRSAYRTFEQVNGLPALRVASASFENSSDDNHDDSDVDDDDDSDSDDYVGEWVRGDGRRGRRGGDDCGGEGQGQGQGQGQGDLATPWSGLETVPEEPYFGGERGEWLLEEEQREQQRRMVLLRDDDEALGGYEYHLRENDEDEEGWRCDGFEATGELCLRHSQCLREALAIGSGN